MTLVLDASVVAEFLVASTPGMAVAERIAEHDGALHLPHLAVVETASVLRTWVRRGEVSEQRAATALTDLADLPAQRWPTEPLLTRMWELRDNATAYDASYVALAELLDADLLTADRHLARGLTALTRCRIVVLAAEGE